MENNLPNVLRFDLTPHQVKFKNILNKEFVELEIYAISDANPNRNRSHFTLESMKSAVESGGIKNKPIVGFFERGDFTTHEGSASYDPELGSTYWDTLKGERILGWVRESDKVEIVQEDDLYWIRFTCVLCVKYCYNQVKRLLKDRRKKVSVEITVNESVVRDDGVLDILAFTLNGTTILGSKYGKPVEEGIEGAHLSILERLSGEEFSEQKKVVSFAYDQINGNDGTQTNEKGVSDNMDYSIKVNKSKDALSEKDWGGVDKAALRQKVIGASNFKEIASDIFLQLRDGWEDGVAGALKYPVMCIEEDDTAVYNRGALSSALAYAKKNNETDVISRLDSIYEDLGLEKDEKECDGLAYCDLYDSDDSDPAAAGDGNDGDCNSACGGQNDCGGENPVNEGDPNGGLQMGHDEGEGDPQPCAADDEACHALECKIQEMSEKIAELEANCKAFQDEAAAVKAEFEAMSASANEYKVRAEAAEALVSQYKSEKLKSFALSIMTNEHMSKEDYDRILADCASMKYACEEDIKKDVAYAVFNARPTGSSGISMPIVTAPSMDEGKDTSNMTREQRIAARVKKH